MIYLDGTFQDATSFNRDLNSWSVSNVTNMGSAFKDATAFNGNISAWNTGKVDYLWYTFQGASSFNQYIGSWDVSNATNMINMFDGASSFNQDLTSWDVSYFSSEPNSFSLNANAWALNKRPLWGTPQLSSSSPSDGATGVDGHAPARGDESADLPLSRSCGALKVQVPRSPRALRRPISPPASTASALAGCWRPNRSPK